MFAVAFDLEVAATTDAHPKGLRQAYADVERTLNGFGFVRVQGSVYVTDNEDLTKSSGRSTLLRLCPGFPRAFAISGRSVSNSGPTSRR
jgi:virulence-associated protein VapD